MNGTFSRAHSKIDGYLQNDKVTFNDWVLHRRGSLLMLGSPVHPLPRTPPLSVMFEFQTVYTLGHHAPIPNRLPHIPSTLTKPARLRSASKYCMALFPPCCWYWSTVPACPFFEIPRNPLAIGDTLCPTEKHYVSWVDHLALAIFIRYGCIPFCDTKHIQSTSCQWA